MRVLMCNRRWIVFAFAAVLGLLLTILATSPARAEGPPLGDCFGGALSDDQLNCYILEQAEEEEIIDIAAIYYATEGMLYVYLTQTEPVGDKVGLFFRKKATEFIDSWPDIAFPEPYPAYLDTCVNHPRARIERGAEANPKSCLLDVTHWTGDDILPYTSASGRILLRVGGADARRSELGWAGFRQLWPASASGASGASGSFDVSDVDLTNFPEFGCHLTAYYGERCENNPKSDIAAWATGGMEGESATVYIEYKNPPEGEAELESLEETLYPYCRRVAVCTKIILDTSTSETTAIATATSTKPGALVKFHGPLANSTSTLTIVSEDLDHYLPEVNRLLSMVIPDSASTLAQTHYNPEQDFVTQVEIIPVKYNYADLRRYETILNRFASSRGNTVGIVDAQLSDNTRFYGGDTALWTPNGPGPAEEDEQGYYNAATIRSTILVRALDTQKAFNALPQLLPTLGIPLEAVGAVHWADPGRDGHVQGYGVTDDLVYTRDSLLPPGQPLLHQFLYRAGVPSWIPMWVNYSVLAVVALGIIGAIVFLMYLGIIRVVRLTRRGQA